MSIEQVNTPLDHTVGKLIVHLGQIGLQLVEKWLQKPVHTMILRFFFSFLIAKVGLDETLYVLCAHL